MFEEECENLNNAKECDSCLFERVICQQEGECLLRKEEQLKND